MRIDAATVEFRDVPFAHPLRLSGVSIDRVTMAVVRVRSGDRRGTGASMLPVPWAWPGDPEIPWAAKDQALRELTVSLARAAVGAGMGDPFTVHDHLAAGVGTPDVPSLATTLTLAAVDNAVHDAAGHLPSLALRAHGFARRHGMFVTIQDLTAVDLALVHSARLAAALPWSSPAFEANSHQYCPAANEALAREMPDLVRVRDGHIEVG